MHQLAADVEVLVDNEHGRPEVPCPDGGVQPHTPRHKDNDIRFIVPFNALSACLACPRQHGRTDPCGGSALEEITPAESLLFLKLWFFPPGVALLGHVCSSLEFAAGDRTPEGPWPRHFSSHTEVVRLSVGSLRFHAATNRKLTNRALDVEFDPRHLREQLDIGAPDRTSTEPHIGRHQVKRLHQYADILQNERICDRAVLPGNPAEARGNRIRIWGTAGAPMANSAPFSSASNSGTRTPIDTSACPSAS